MARLAIASDNQRTGLGKLLVLDAMRRTLAIREHAGIIGLFVDAKNSEAADYYKQNFGFVPLQEDPLNLFLPIHTISRAF
jgi:predicted N-acetyltransferase YhbS